LADLVTDGRRARGRVDWRFIAYNLLLLLLSPLLLLGLLYRMVVRGKSREGLRERLGFVSPQAAEFGQHRDPVIWVQACSVGEVAAVAPVIEAVRAREPLAHVVLSTTTPTGRELAARRGLEVDAVTYFPFDLPFVVGKALSTVRPDMLVMVDTELWPNMMAVARSAGIRTAVINGRISDKAYPRDLVIRPILSWTLGNIDRVLAQSDKDAARFRALGAREDRVEVLGNCKFDEDMPSVPPAEASRLRMELGLPEGAPILVAGSTREGEEAKVLDAFVLARQEHLDLQLVIAPRHPQRGDEIEQLILERGYAVYRRSRAVREGSAAEAVGPQVRIVLLDTIGELTKVYALATVVFVGGSLVPWGGHNILQPLAQGKPTVVGPWMHNQQDLMEIALAEEAVSVVQGQEELGELVARLIGSPQEQELFAARGAAMLARHRGASERYADQIVALLREGRDETDVPV